MWKTILIAVLLLIVAVLVLVLVNLFRPANSAIWGWGFHRMARSIDRVAVIIGAQREAAR